MLALAEEDAPLLLVFTRSDYEAWRSSISEPDVAASLEQIAHGVMAGNAPLYLRQQLQAAKDTQRSIDPSVQVSALQDSDELVVVPMVTFFCALCGFVVAAILSWALGKFVFDPLYEDMKAWWEEPHHIVSRRLSATTPCPTQMFIGR